MTTFLLAHPWIPPGVITLLIVLGPVMGRRLLDRPRLAWSVAVVALLPVVVLTLWPVATRAFARCTVEWALPTPRAPELLANVALFIAPALFVGVAMRRPAVVLVGAGGVSAALEATQALLPGLGRACSTLDWTNNTIGAVVGAGLAAIALARARRRPPGARVGAVPVHAGAWGAMVVLVSAWLWVPR